MKEFEEMKAREKAATEGPWEHIKHGTGIRGGGTYNFITLASGRGIVAERTQSGTAADAEFIAHARADVPRLLAALDAITALAERHGVKSWTEEIFNAIDNALEGKK